MIPRSHPCGCIEPTPQRTIGTNGNQLAALMKATRWPSVRQPALHERSCHSRRTCGVATQVVNLMCVVAMHGRIVTLPQYSYEVTSEDYCTPHQHTPYATRYASATSIGSARRSLPGGARHGSLPPGLGAAARRFCAVSGTCWPC